MLETKITFVLVLYPTQGQFDAIQLLVNLILTKPILQAIENFCNAGDDIITASATPDQLTQVH